MERLSGHAGPTVQRPRGVRSIGFLILLLCLTIAPTGLPAAEKQGGQAVQGKPAKAPRTPIPSGAESSTPTIKWVKPYDAIDGEPSYNVTYERTVALELNRGGGPPTHYRVSESSSFSGQDWRVYRPFPPISYTFAQDSPGDKTIYLQLMNNQGQSPVASGSIEYRKPPVLQQLTLNNGQATVHEREVTVSWTYTGSASRIFLSESSSFTNAQPHTLSGTSGSGSFTLSAGHGQKTVYAKVVDEPLPFNKASNVRSDQINFQPYPDQVHTLTESLLVEFFQLAQSNGYGFSTQVLDGKGTCTQSVENTSVMKSWYLKALGEQVPLGAVPGAPPPIGGYREEDMVSGPITCVFHLLQGKNLRTGWKVGPVNLVRRRGLEQLCTGWQFLQRPSGTGTAPQISLKGWVTNGCIEKEGFARIKQLTLQGPSNEDWRMALEP